SATSRVNASTAFSKAQCNGVIHAEFLVHAPAPFASRRAVIPYEPQRADQCSGVLPALFFTFGSAPAVSRISTISSLFAATAKCNGVRP
ncbi:hypothetical protein L873DRAFT_1638449, partial [Choiromyces venosus 120613-1]